MFQRHQAVVSGDSIVVGVSDRNDSYGSFFCLFYGKFHSFVSDDLAEALSAVDERGSFRLFENSALVCRFCPAVLQIIVVSREPCDSVRVDPSEVVGYQTAGCYWCVLLLDSECAPGRVSTS